MTLDTTLGVDAIKLKFDITFHKIPCDSKQTYIFVKYLIQLTIYIIEISFLQEVTRGTLHDHGPANLYKKEEQAGCNASGSIIMDKASGNFRFVIEPDKKKDAENEEKPNGFQKGNVIFLSMLSGIPGYDLVKPPDLR